MNRKFFFLIKLCLLFLLSGLFKLSYARILNVPDDFQTIQAGIDAAEDDDTVLVAPGEFRENLRIEMSLTLASLTLTTRDTAYIDSTVLNGRQQGSVITISRNGNTSPRIIGFTIRNGLASNGGGLNCSATTVHLEDLLITQNGTPEEGYGFGGGVYANQTALFLLRVRLIDNFCSGRGGGIFTSEVSPITMVNCILLRNRTLGDGGGFRLTDDVTLRNVLIAKNYGENMAGAAQIYGNGEVLMEHVTLVDNQSPVYGAFQIEGPRVLGFSNCIIYGNISNNNPIHAIVNQINLSYSDIEGGVQAFGNRQVNVNEIMDVEPLFVDSDVDDYTLRWDSPCIDVGDPDSPLDPDGTRADMGAFYFHQRDIEVPGDPIDYGQLWVGESSGRIVPIRNIGGTPLQIDQIVVNGNYYTVDIDGNFELLPDSSCDVTVTFAPEDSGEWSGSLTIVSDDFDEDTLSISLTGQGEWWPISVSSDPHRSSIFDLQSAFPNPFNSSTTITFSVGQVSKPVRLTIHDLSGRLVADLTESTFRNPHSAIGKVVWNAEGIPGGIYLVRLESGARKETIKTILMK